MASKQHTLFWGSSYDRGLDILLSMWGDIKAKYPDAMLHVTYGWDLFDKATVANKERQEWKKTQEELMKQEGIVHHGRVGKDELSKIRKQCGIWAYPTYFPEIFCITAIEAQADGVVPVAINYAALSETVGSGTLIEGDIYNKDVQEKFKEELLRMMGDESWWKKQQVIGGKFANTFGWGIQANKWATEFSVKPKEDVKVSVITPTIRRGWWNIMSKNLSEQTYKNIEWIIVDDYEQDRSEIAKSYAKRYGLTIKYVRGKERKIKRTYGLINANNTGWKVAEGELVVILQDFVLIPNDGIEQLVLVHKKNPDALIAPVDMYFKPKVKPDITKEDWFDGETDIVGAFMRQNARIANKGLRESVNAYEFEQNYGAIPKKIIDDLGGWYEFFDEGLGFDNTEFAYRALKMGYRILVDETNCAVCIDHWEALAGTKEHGIGRERNLNDPRFIWLMNKIDTGELPLQRTQEKDDTIELLYEMPKDVTIGMAKDWIRDENNLANILSKW